ncbi:putative acetolactate synthase small subunit [bacterium BMS3Abin02]|nr:putative acetolactate synthase small subunit [bacterium BMS3Abin02]GBE23604.1 putative acetolactate synthase small subunit [bacterium BMS3Bbin01]HDH27230.1 acetolactate synthase small subunit [Actinomycetota bacterium]HDK45355.1 acetolactate synthase small subunit [Actinomycetota bacterium]HDL49515.1 acetolactate synthase small subunit [Actinomycetota bacterium]
MQIQHTLSVLVEDRPGVLARVSLLLARRGFNIHSLAVGPARDDGTALMTIVVEAPELEQVKKQLHKLINVVKIAELDPEQSLEREIMIVRVSAPSSRRGEVLEVAAIFKAIAVDVGPATIAFQVTGDATKLRDFLNLVRPYGITDLVTSGRIAMAREVKNNSASLRAIG